MAGLSALSSAQTPIGATGASYGCVRVVGDERFGADVDVRYHPGLGVPVVSVDPNGVSTVTRYDCFGQPREQKGR